MTVRYKTGNKATLVLTGTLTTGIGTAWAGTIVSINPGEWTIGERDVSLLSDEDFMRVDPQDLATTNEISGVVRFRPSLGVPVVDGTINTATLTFPKESTATTGVTQATLAGKAFFSRAAFPNLANNETMDAEFTLKMTGESLALTPEAAS
jgi:hypothetical protein